MACFPSGRSGPRWRSSFIGVGSSGRVRRCFAGPLKEDGYAGGVPGVEDFDRYVDEHGIPEEDYPAAFAL